LVEIFNIKIRNIDELKEPEKNPEENKEILCCYKCVVYKQKEDNRCDYPLFVW